MPPPWSVYITMMVRKHRNNRPQTMILWSANTLPWSGALPFRRHDSLPTTAPKAGRQEPQTMGNSRDSFGDWIPSSHHTLLFALLSTPPSSSFRKLILNSLCGSSVHGNFVLWFLITRTEYRHTQTQSLHGLLVLLASAHYLWLHGSSFRFSRTYRLYNPLCARFHRRQ